MPDCFHDLPVPSSPCHCLFIVLGARPMINCRNSTAGSVKQKSTGMASMVAMHRRLCRRLLWWVVIPALLLCSNISTVQSSFQLVPPRDGGAMLHHCRVNRCAALLVNDNDSKDNYESFVNMHMLSLQYPPDDAYCDISNFVWMLGETSTRALQRFIQDRTHWPECVILSTCARLEFIVVHSPSNTTTAAISVQQLQRALSSALLARRAADRSAKPDPHQVDVLVERWQHLEGSDVCRHLCRVAAGLAARPRDPCRPVIFRPFHAGDAHIMSQLKGTHKRAISTGNPTVATVLKHALRAGKACRNVHALPAIEELRYHDYNDYYDCEEFSSFQVDSDEPPLHVQVAAVAEQAVIEPAVQSCADLLRAQQVSFQIARFRRRVLALATDREEKQFLRRALHGPTIQMRAGEHVDTEAVVRDMQLQLLFRCVQGTGPAINSLCVYLPVYAARNIRRKF